MASATITSVQLAALQGAAIHYEAQVMALSNDRPLAQSETLFIDDLCELCKKIVVGTALAAAVLALVSVGVFALTLGGLRIARDLWVKHECTSKAEQAFFWTVAYGVQAYRFVGNHAPMVAIVTSAFVALASFRMAQAFTLVIATPVFLGRWTADVAAMASAGATGVIRWAVG